MNKILNVKATMDINVEADSGQVALQIVMAGETLVAVRLTPEQALAIGQKFLDEAFAATQPETTSGGER